MPSVADLHEAAGLGRVVELRVHHAGARRHVLHRAARKRLAVAQRVLVCQAAVHHVREDLGVAVRVPPAQGQLGYSAQDLCDLHNTAGLTQGSGAWQDQGTGLVWCCCGNTSCSALSSYS